METHAGSNKPIHPLAWAAGSAVIIFSAVGVGAFMGWIPNSMGYPSEKSALEAAPPKAASMAAPAATPAKQAAAPARQAAPVQPAAVATPRAPAPATPILASAKCTECGVIESVREIESKGEGTGLGAVGGAVAGSLLGSQVGGGRGQDVMTVVGAVGGGLAGHEVEKRMKSTKSYAVTIRLDDGTSRTFNQATLPSWRNGDKVRVVNGAIQSNG